MGTGCGRAGPNILQNQSAQARNRQQAMNGLFLLAPWIKYPQKDRTVPEKVTLVEDPTLLAQLEPNEADGFAFGAVVQNKKNWERFCGEWLPGLLAGRTADTHRQR